MKNWRHVNNTKPVLRKRYEILYHKNRTRPQLFYVPKINPEKSTSPFEERQQNSLCKTQNWQVAISRVPSFQRRPSLKCCGWRADDHSELFVSFPFSSLSVSLKLVWKSTLIGFPWKHISQLDRHLGFSFSFSWTRPHGCARDHFKNSTAYRKITFPFGKVFQEFQERKKWMHLIKWIKFARSLLTKHINNENYSINVIACGIRSAVQLYPHFSNISLFNWMQSWMQTPYTYIK